MKWTNLAYRGGKRWRQRAYRGGSEQLATLLGSCLVVLVTLAVLIAIHSAADQPQEAGETEARSTAGQDQEAGGTEIEVIGRIQASSPGPVAFIGDRVLAGLGSTVHAFDSNAASFGTPAEVATIQVALPGQVRALESQSGFVFAAAGSSIVVLDSMTAEPAQPVASIDLESQVVDLAVWQGHLAAAVRKIDGTHSLFVLDISDPSTPQEIGGFTTDMNTLVRIRSTSDHLIALGNLGDGSSALQVFDLTDPISPSFSGQYVFNDKDRGWAEDLAVVDGFAYVGIGPIEPSVVIIDYRDPTQPSRAGVVTETSNCSVKVKARRLLVASDRLFVASLCFLDAYELDAPANPSFVSTGILWLPFMGAPTHPVSIASNGDAVSILVDDGTLHVIGAQSVTLRGKAALPTKAMESHGIAAIDEYLLIANHEDQKVAVYDVSRAESPFQATNFWSGGFSELDNGYNPITIHDSWGLIEGYDPVLVDLEDPTSPRTLDPDWWGPEGIEDAYAWGLTASGSRVYMATRHLLFVYGRGSLEDPLAPIAWYEPGIAGAGFTEAGDLAASGDHIFYWNEEGTGLAYDLSDPSIADPSAMVEFYADGGCHRPDIEVSGRRIYVVCDDGLHFVDLDATPDKVRSDGTLVFNDNPIVSTEHVAMHVSLDRWRALVTDSRNLYVLDMRDPDRVVELARYQHTSMDAAVEDWEVRYAMSIAHRGKVYVSSSVTGIHILEINLPDPFDAARIILPWIRSGFRQ